MQGDATTMGGEDAHFPITNWVRVRQAQGRDEAAQRKALEDLARAYWKPLYCFLRAGGTSNEAAKDLVQGFFAALIEGEAIARYEPGRGHFRSYLLGCLKRYVAGERERASAQKRGGAATTVSLDESIDEGWQGIVGKEIAPEAAYDRCWALEKLGRAVAAVRTEWERQGRADLLVVLDGFMTGEDPARPGYAELSARSGLTEDGVRHALERIKAALERALLEELGSETAGEAAAREELAALTACLKRPGQ